MTIEYLSVRKDRRVERSSQYRTSVIIAVFVALLSGYVYLSFERQAHLSYLQLLIKSSVTTNAQVFYDTGNGLSEDESRIQPLQEGGTFRSVRYSLPDRPIHLLRFDPIASGGGKVILRKAELVNSEGTVEQTLPLETLQPANDIASMQLTDEGLVIETLPSAKDPQTIFVLRYPIVLPRPPLLWTAVIAVSWLVSTVLACVAVFVAVFKLLAWSSLRYRWAHINRPFAFMAEAISNDDFIVFDGFAIWFYSICVTIFLAMCIAGLHGSSIDIFSSGYHRGAPGVEPIIGTPRGIRSDEWNYHTPWILNQYLRPDRFSPKGTVVGPGNAGLIANIPVRHFTTIFRPEFWGFFVLPFDNAYSIYWEAKWLILLTGLFTLLLLITHSTTVSAIGALWFLFSAFTQWQFSWPSLLPDLVGLCCWIICLSCYLLVSRSVKWACIAGVGLIICAVDFALCLYVPHQIPLVWFALCAIAYWIIIKYSSIWEPGYRLRRFAIIMLALFSIALILGLFYRDVAETVTALANTTYPGHRLVGGGGYNLFGLGSHLFDFWTTESSFPPALGNICEASGFLWLAPVTLFCFSRVRPLDRKQKIAFVCFGLFFVAILSWEVLPIAASTARFTFFDRVPAGRALPTLGLVNIVLVMTALSWPRKRLARGWGQHLIEGAGIFGIALIILGLVNLGFGNFYGLEAVAVAAALVAVAAKCLLEGWVLGFGVAVVAPLVIAYSFVNPLDRGFDTIFRSELFQTVQSHPALRQGKWLVFSQAPTLDPWGSGFVEAVGCDVFNGLKYVPDLKDLELFDTRGTNSAKLNQSAYLLVELAPNGSSEDFERLGTVGILVWKVNPLDPRLRQIGIRYLAFPFQPPPEVLKGLKAAANNPISTFWIYELP